MVKLEELTIKELRSMGKEMGVSEYSSIAKADLIKRIYQIEAKYSVSEEKKQLTDSLIDSVAPVALSFKAKQWLTYFERVKITAETFHQRFPNHQDTEYILEVVAKQKHNGK